MATDKNKIIVYADWQKTFNKLTDEEAGRLIKHFFNYVNDENPDPPDRLTEIAFEPIKQTLKRDLKKWEQIADRNRENGSKGGRPTKPTETQNNPVGFSETQSNPEKPVSVSVRDSVIVSDKEILLKKEPKVIKADLDFSKFDSSDIKSHWSLWVGFKQDEFKKGYKSVKYEQIAVEALAKLARGSTTMAEQIIMQSISNRYQGLFELKHQSNGNTTNQPKRTLEDQARAVVERIHGKGAYEVATGQHGHDQRGDNETTG